jgi:predicted acylesterase/phospholipase RssA
MAMSRIPPIARCSSRFNLCGLVPRRIASVAAAFCVVLGVAGCASLAPRAALPEQLADSATLGLAAPVRLWGDTVGPATDTMARNAVSPLRQRFSGKRAKPVAEYLAISGGGEDGAFGAGLLVGWGERGTRPDFDLVTGVSAGALIAPFAFLERDAELSQVFTQIKQRDILKLNIVDGLLGGPALADSSPLAHLLDFYIDDAFLRDVARERDKGRILLIGTTNLDAQRPVLWDMGMIAKSRDPRAPVLFRKILLASASIPGVFPPVRIQVQADGRTYDEIHVDGGVTQQVFLAPSAFAFRDMDRLIGHATKRRLYVLRNGKVTPEWDTVTEKVLPVAQRSILTLTKNQGIGDIYRIYLMTRRDGIDFNLATIPASFTDKSPEPFDQNYMQKLYQVGFALGRDGYSWEKVPPGLAARREAGR